MKITEETKLFELNTESVLVAAAQAEPDKFEALYEKYYHQLFHFVYQRTGHKDNSFDLCEQVFLKAMLNIKKYNYRNLPFSAWLFRIAISEIADFYRNHKKIPVVNVEYEQLILLKEEINDSKGHDIEKMLDCMQQLSLDEIRLIELRFFENRAFKEIGNILDITENNAKVKLYRILDKLKKILLNS